MLRKVNYFVVVIPKHGGSNYAELTKRFIGKDTLADAKGYYSEMIAANIGNAVTVALMKYPRGKAAEIVRQRFV